ncbi:MAG TPA: HEAT repeat domain-containing protein, partial [Gemmatales bacterium]|nr:HEAT repeat domain-containing protein [Gemmatales bacterium]
PDLAACKELPLVKTFRESIVFDAAPAIDLLGHRRPEVRMAALSALEFRPTWRPGQVDQVLNAVQGEAVPVVRVAAINAVANVDERRPTELLAEALHDNDPRVRQAASDALFWDSHRPWDWMRNGVRATLADPKLHDCGSLLREGQTLPRDGVQSLLAWSAERGQVSVRAAQTLAVYYLRALQERTEEVREELMKTVLDPQAPPLLRIQFARLLARNRMIDMMTLEKLVDASNPAPLRLMSAELLLSVGYNSTAVGCLREVSKLPNRELALDTARIVQNYLNVDMGLAVGQPPPPAGSPKAAEIARRLTLWAAKSESGESALDSTYKPAGMQ